MLELDKDRWQRLVESIRDGDGGSSSSSGESGIVHSALVLKDNSDGVRGLYASRDIAAGETLLSIPPSRVIHPNKSVEGSPVSVFKEYHWQACHSCIAMIAIEEKKGEKREESYRVAEAAK
jgi:hypothetical protein